MENSHKNVSFRFKIISLALIIIPSIVSDQWSKVWAVENLKYKQPIHYIGGLLKFIYAENKGAWGSLGGNWPEFWRMTVLIYLPIAFVIGLVGFALFYPKIRKVEVIAYACIVAGGAGNLIDRIRYDYVVDFLYMGHGKIGTNIFNIADVVIMIGFGLIIFTMAKDGWINRNSKKPSTPV
jgi:signal peptidase II